MLSKELKAMHKVSEVLKEFDNTTRQRVLEYVSKMSWSEEHKKHEAEKAEILKGGRSPQVPISMYRGIYESTYGLEQPAVESDNMMGTTHKN